jgi:hypothetical protein
LSGFGLILGYRPNSVRNFDWLPFTPPSGRLFGPSTTNPVSVRVDDEVRAARTTQKKTVV